MTRDTDRQRTTEEREKIIGLLKVGPMRTSELSGTLRFPNDRIKNHLYNMNLKKQIVRLKMVRRVGFENQTESLWGLPGTSVDDFDNLSLKGVPRLTVWRTPPPWMN